MDRQGCCEMTIARKKKNNKANKPKKVSKAEERRLNIATLDAENKELKQIRQRLGNSAGSMQTILGFFSLTDQLKF